MVQHVLKSDPALRELEHIQADSPGLADLFFDDRHGHQPHERSGPCHAFTHS